MTEVLTRLNTEDSPAQADGLLLFEALMQRSANRVNAAPREWVTVPSSSGGYKVVAQDIVDLPSK